MSKVAKRVENPYPVAMNLSSTLNVLRLEAYYNSRVILNFGAILNLRTRRGAQDDATM